MSLAILATMMQLAVAREILANEPASGEPRYLWALRFAIDNDRRVLATLRDPSDRTRKATETRRALHDFHVQRARELWPSLTNQQIGAQIAAEEGHAQTPYPARTVQRWRRA